jgi:hypothetical protein
MLTILACYKKAPGALLAEDLKLELERVFSIDFSLKLIRACES